jgi:hypothetical protein
MSLNFEQPLGERVADGGYHLDLRVKAPEAAWPPPHFIALDQELWVVIAQFGLGAHEQFVATADEQWLQAAIGAGEHVLGHMIDGGELDGGLPHAFAYPHTFRLEKGWLSAMAQGEAASLLVRLHRATGEERFAEGARRVLGPNAVHRDRGGTGVPWEGGWWPEEYPTTPSSFVLNGGIFALFGSADTAGLGDDAARDAFEAGAQLLSANLHRWDVGWWSRYDLYPFRIPNIASLAYQRLHVDQLRALDRIRPDAEVRRRADRFERQLGRRTGAAAATVAKVAFRAAVPRRKD